MKEILHKIKKPLCGTVIAICIFLLLGFTGECECGGDLKKYVIRGVILLTVAIIAGVKGELFE